MSDEQQYRENDANLGNAVREIVADELTPALGNVQLDAAEGLDPLRAHLAALTMDVANVTRLLTHALLELLSMQATYKEHIEAERRPQLLTLLGELKGRLPRIQSDVIDLQERLIILEQSRLPDTQEAETNDD